MSTESIRSCNSEEEGRGGGTRSSQFSQSFELQWIVFPVDTRVLLKMESPSSLMRNSDKGFPWEKALWYDLYVPSLELPVLWWLKDKNTRQWCSFTMRKERFLLPAEHTSLMMIIIFSVVVNELWWNWVEETESERQLAFLAEKLFHCKLYGHLHSCLRLLWLEFSLILLCITRQAGKVRKVEQSEREKTLLRRVRETHRFNSRKREKQKQTSDATSCLLWW